MSMSLRLLSLLAALALLAACSTTPPREEPPEKDPDVDYGPADPPDLSRVPEPEPRDEPRSRYGNPESYQVFGRTYHVMDDVVEFEQEGLASWYGKKFHGRRTSSGETYDMYAMTAAHKELPIPIYVRVTNLENQRSVVVRVNDRGPFAPGRIIDLSYAAADRLGMVDQGTARVRIQTLSRTLPPEDAPPRLAGGEDAVRPAAASEPGSDNGNAASVAPARMPGEVRADTWYLQAGAFSQRQNAENLKRRLSGMALAPVSLYTDADSAARYRVRLGPLESRAAVERLSEQLRERGLGDRHLVIAP
ncbi:MAG: septal ring lytic transglycosylase RlpA family protein [Ectothiorhodospiraceae bacterium]|nr:septal ring lytic transglycosylase RlpA family protein [Ectothiorhodospiraceae bacterium]